MIPAQRARYQARMSLRLERTVEAVREGYGRQSSMRSFISPTHVAHTVLFLSSQGAARISGQALAVDGHLESTVTTF
jgi:NAD(P)-dependent dehydrogenase (short-subunit alcohol dehydrogenase family)